jgi:phosphoglycerate kinase
MIKSISRVKKLEGKVVFLRVDFNVPVEKGKILDDFKIRQSLEDIDYLLSKKTKIIVATHLGSPKGKYEASLSTKIVATALGKVLKKKIIFSDLTKAKSAVAKLKIGDILFLENLRFYPGEKKNSSDFAKKLAGLADIYINNAFAVSHREDASVSRIKKYLPSYAGLLLEKEIEQINKVMHPKKPLVVLIGGEKIGTKTQLIKNFLKVADKILVGGALANSFLLAEGYELGKSLVDESEIGVAKMLLKKSRSFLSSKGKILLPLDVITATDKNCGPKNVIHIRKVSDISQNECICDIGPETIEIFAKELKKANTLVWNGPVGLFEEPHFRHGTVILARVIASRSSGKAFGLVGGGETTEALDLTGMGHYVDWVSTAGGAMLAYLGKEPMPGLKGIVR